MTPPAQEQVSCSPPAPPTAISSASPGGAAVWSCGVEAREFVPERQLGETEVVGPRLSLAAEAGAGRRGRPRGRSSSNSVVS